jgi:hypothetical protein
MVQIDALRRGRPRPRREELSQDALYLFILIIANAGYQDHIKLKMEID